tara:strand:+ start:416 stop:1519 length:1104 start_codon:yes stop_codon:yes gene_type:complete
MSRYLLPLIAVGLAWQSCSSPTQIENPQQTLVVQALLQPGGDTEVLLMQTLPPESYYESLIDSVRGAQVEISVDDQTFALAEDAQRPGVYRIATATMPVEEGKTYELTAAVDQRQVRARTTVPFRAEVTQVSADTIVYFQSYADLFGELIHPGEFHWDRSPNAAGYVIIIEAAEVSTLPTSIEPLTGELDRLIEQRDLLQGQVSEDSLTNLNGQIEDLRAFFATHLSLTRADGSPIRYLRDRQAEEWEEIEDKDWTEGKKWRKRRDTLYDHSFVDYWVPADTLRSDYWWLGVRFEGEYKIHLQSVDQNYFDYFTTRFNGDSGNDADTGPLFHIDGGLGLFGSYTEDTFRVIALRGEEQRSFKITTRQ